MPSKATGIELDAPHYDPRGGVRTVLLQGEVLGAEGIPQFLHGSYQDIAERKRVETQLAARRGTGGEHREDGFP
jgi:hypothetical protein